MPGFFPDVRAAALAGQIVRAGILVDFDFTTTPLHLWLGFGSLEAGGETYQGAGELVSISGIESAIGGTAPQTGFTLSGVDADLVTRALDASDEVKGRDVTVSFQFFDDAQQALDTPFVMWVGSMDTIRIRAEGPATRSIEVTAETLFVRRSAPPWAWLSDRDQQRLFPGDVGLEFVPSMASKTVVWPLFDEEP